jgi:glycosyltransferase involved in cell wall biosynthesis
MMEALAIILPAYNEDSAIFGTIEAFFKAAPHALIVVVDNASTDNTAMMANRAFLELGCRGQLLFEEKKGKANAVRCALEKVKAQIYVLADADQTYPADEIPRLIEPIQKEGVHMVVGDRLSRGAYDNQNTRPFHGLGNRLISAMINIFFGGHLKDCLSGFRALSRSFVKNLPILSSGFELEVEMTIFALHRRYLVREIAISYGSRPQGSVSKLATFRDGLRIIIHVVRMAKTLRLGLRGKS